MTITPTPVNLSHPYTQVFGKKKLSLTLTASLIEKLLFNS